VFPAKKRGRRRVKETFPAPKINTTRGETQEQAQEIHRNAARRLLSFSPERIISKENKNFRIGRFVCACSAGRTYCAKLVLLYISSHRKILRFVFFQGKFGWFIKIGEVLVCANNIDNR
jgi:hypothetical protein